MVQGKVIPALKQHEHYRYLGVSIGVMHDVDEIDNFVGQLCTDLDKINESHLAPWQKLDAIRTFVQPSLTFALRTGEPEKASLIKYHCKLIEVVRNICKLQPNISSLWQRKLVDSLFKISPLRLTFKPLSKR